MCAHKVIAGSGLDVGFALISPTGHRLVSDFRRSDSIHTVSPTEDGDYRLCFDNSFSKLYEKIVFFGVIMTPNSQSGTSRGQDEWVDMVMTENTVEYQLEDIRARMDSVYQRLERSRQVLTSLRASEARDRFLLEDNLWRVSFWSCLNMLVMLTVAAAQIYTVQRLFDDTKRTHT
ncbi:putative transmembrane emp24 domain-containing protein 1 [Scophthalmus maximus]|uniref:Putative transmembrane emp24 domain-containing protein 1 n=1 Tax=Scophthalmus maximus TaxID=52904 RepID=A0A2U9CSV4_SCOMX|nr:putative transmembrane emp24 domain-containing protein 1 [Scophthalmus maximus]